LSPPLINEQEERKCQKWASGERNLPVHSVVIPGLDDLLLDRPLDVGRQAYYSVGVWT
jgi:hypothetical protein